MMERTSKPGERGGVARPPPFGISTITYKVVVYAPADTLPLFLLSLYMYSVIYLTGHLPASSAGILE
jgi:hypothetical protein